MPALPLALEWSEHARHQLREILSYYSAHASRAVARRVLQQIRDEAERLTRFPRSEPAIAGLDGSYRRARAGAYLLLYRVSPTGDVVRIMTVRHARWRPLTAGEIAMLDESDA